jgi:hypothetical protein
MIEDSLGLGVEFGAPAFIAVRSAANPRSSSSLPGSRINFSIASIGGSAAMVLRKLLHSLPFIGMIQQISRVASPTVMDGSLDKAASLQRAIEMQLHVAVPLNSSKMSSSMRHACFGQSGASTVRLALSSTLARRAKNFFGFDERSSLRRRQT